MISGLLGSGGFQPGGHGGLTIDRDVINEERKLPSGKRLHNYGKSPCLMGKSTISSGEMDEHLGTN
jgi:hypothetical protein